jgi:hypothetical protein
MLSLQLVLEDGLQEIRNIARAAGDRPDNSLLAQDVHQFRRLNKTFRRIGHDCIGVEVMDMGGILARAQAETRLFRTCRGGMLLSQLAAFPKEALHVRGFGEDTPVLDAQAGFFGACRKLTMPDTQAVRREQIDGTLAHTNELVLCEEAGPC